MRDNKLFRKKGVSGGGGGGFGLDDDLSKFEIVKHELKTGIFGVFYILLKQDESSLWKFLVVYTILFI